ncbi:maltose permease MAL31 [Aspergillus lentulus]|uniref:Maltose permease MAL31 n=1 Tax=Aspergillus lentulus TaxID=293939 RepID=A0AAN4PEY1_ASPLE|nr:maltose permease MAL31 [Aspergillus lentulus]
MGNETVVPSENELKNFSPGNPDVVELIRHAQESDAADRLLTVRQALSKYKKAVFWAMFLSTSLIMEGYDLVIITSFYGQSQFIERFGEFSDKAGKKVITAAWQSGLSNSSMVGQLTGLLLNAYAQDRFGCRPTMMFFMAWMALMIFIPVFAPSLPILAWGEAMCGVSWGVFQTLSTTYASEVVPTVLRPYVTAYACMCWGAGILLSSGVVRAVAGIEGDLGWRLPFVLQWVWPIPLFIGAYLAPESPWNAVRRGKVDQARKSLKRLRQDTPEKDREIEATLAYIQHTTKLEQAETENASFLECFKGTNRRRTEINCVVWAAQTLSGNAILGYSVVFLEAAGFTELQAFDVNISLSACYIIGGVICWLLFPHFGRATIYMSGLSFMFVCMVIIGGLGFAEGSKGAQLAIGILLVICTLINMVTVGPVCYPIVAETPSGRLRYKTIVIGRFVYNLTGIFSNSLTPRMIAASAWNWGAKTGLFYAGTNLLCNIWCWFRLPETKDRTFGEIDLLFHHRVHARKFKYTKVDLIRGRLDLDLRSWHNKYGDVVRSGPDEVTFTTAEAWKDIYGHGHRQLPKVQISTINGKDIFSAYDVDHARFRKALSHAFSTKGLQAQECLVTRYIDKLIERLKEFAESGRAADMGTWYSLATFDLIGDLAFGEPFGGLDRGEYHHWVATMFGFVKSIPFLRALHLYPVVLRVILAFHPGSLMEMRSNSAAGRGELMDSMLRHQGDKDGLSLEELKENANVLILAGSETTAALLSGVTYRLLRTPDALDKVARETKVSVHQLSAYSSPRNFYQADRFLPERWLPEAIEDHASPFFSDNRAVFQPFSIGPRKCLGRNLAYTEMRVILARVLWTFDLELCEDSRDWKDQKVFVIWERGSLMCKLTMRDDRGDLQKGC